MNSKIITGLLAGFFCWQVQSSAQVFERTRHESRTFRVYESTTLEVYNKYGNIHLFGWEGDSVRVEVDLAVKASKESKADKLYEAIDFDFSESRYYIIARTTYGQNQGSLWEELSDLANSMFSAGSKVQVDYHVYLPSDLQVRLENKFGNIYCGDHRGRVEIDLSNGDFKAGDLLGPAELTLSFGSAVVNGIRAGRVKGSYLEMDLGHAEDMTVESKSSTYRIAKAGVLKMDSRRDRFYVEEVSSVTGKSSFSYLTLRGLTHFIRIDTEYGELRVKGIDPGSAAIEVNSKYTDMVFQLSPRVNCKVKIDHSGSATVLYPDAYTGLKVTAGEGKDAVSTVSGYVGDPAASGPEIRITTQSGKVTLQEEIELF